MDPRFKIVGIIAFVFFCNSLKNIYVMEGAVLFSVLLNITMGEGIRTPVKRYVRALPFGLVLMIMMPFTIPGRIVFQNILGLKWMNITYEGIGLFASMLLKFTSSMFLLILLMTTTSFDLLFAGLCGIKVPFIIVEIMEFMVRYFEVFRKEIDRMLTARRSRGMAEKGIKGMAERGRIIGGAFLRAHNRSSRIYDCMLSRCYDGEYIRQMDKPEIYNIIITALIIILGIAMIVIDRSLNI